MKPGCLTRAVFALSLVAAVAAASAVQVNVCYGYGCAISAAVEFTDADISGLRELMALATDAAEERAMLAVAVTRMYSIAGRQTPIWRDRGRNVLDERDNEGAMDCIDHSTNTDRFLNLLADAGALNLHRPGERRRRFEFLVFAEHWAATIVERESGARYAVDSWFFDPGTPAVIVPLARWRSGYDPDSPEMVGGP